MRLKTLALGALATSCQSSAQSAPDRATPSLASASAPSPARFQRAAVVETRPAPIDPRTPEQLVSAACAAFDGSWRCAAPRPHLFGASLSPIIPVSWTVPAWFVDPSDVSGAASDRNSCTTALKPCATYQEIAAHRWGTFSPRLRSNVTIAFISGASNDHDPVIFTPFYEMVDTVSPVIVLEGPLGANQQIATGTIGGVVLTTRANNLAPATATFSVPVGLHQLVFDSTHPSYFWTSLNTGGNTWELTQPLAPYNAGLAQPTKTAPVTIVNGDAFTTYNPVSLTFEKVAAQNDGTTGHILLYHLTVGPDGAHTCTTGTSISIAESIFTAYWHAELPSANLQALCQNCDVTSPMYQDQGAQYPSIGYDFYGGEAAGQYLQGDFTLEGDFVSRSTVNLNSGQLNDVYVASGHAVETYGVTTASQGPIYGTGAFRCNGGCALYLTAGAGQAGITFPLTGGIAMPGVTLALDQSTTPMQWFFRGDQGAPLVVKMDQTIAAGGFGMGATGGCVYSSGSVICNQGP
jgi:hypothetical protein